MVGPEEIGPSKERGGRLVAEVSTEDLIAELMDRSLALVVARYDGPTERRYGYYKGDAAFTLGLAIWAAQESMAKAQESSERSAFGEDEADGGEA